MGRFLCGVERVKRLFTLHYQKLENYKQNFDVVPPLEKFLRTVLLRLAMN